MIAPKLRVSLGIYCPSQTKTTDFATKHGPAVISIDCDCDLLCVYIVVLAGECIYQTTIKEIALGLISQLNYSGDIGCGKPQCSAVHVAKL